MILKFTLFMPQLQESRRIHMYIPDDYASQKKKYPVLYMFDGHNLFEDQEATFGQSWKLAEKIESLGLDLIVVGQECSHEGNRRIEEYAPYPFYDPYTQESFEALADYTMDFFINTLKPYIDSRFPTVSDQQHTWIGGSSCGGSIALYAALHYSHIYSKALVISSFLTPFYHAFLKEAQEMSCRKNLSIYFSWGALEHEEHDFIQETKMISEIANTLINKKIHIQFNVKPKGGHSENDWSEEAPQFLSFLTQI